MMLNLNEVERERYEARRKALLDYNTGLKVGNHSVEPFAPIRWGCVHSLQAQCNPFLNNARKRENRRYTKVARMEGREEGRVEGEKIGIIQLSERLLNRPATPIEQLTRLPLEDLITMADELQEQLLKK